MTIDKKNFSVPPYYSDLSNVKLEVNRNILGVDMQNAALNANYIVGNGMQKIPLTNIGDGPVNTTLGYKLRTIDITNANVANRLWLFNFTTYNGPGKIHLEITNSLGDMRSFDQSVQCSVSGTVQTIDTFSTLNQPITIEGSVYAQIDNEIRIQNVSSSIRTSNLILNSISMMDMPRTNMNPTTQSEEWAVDTLTNKVGSPLYAVPADSRNYASYGGIRNMAVQFYPTNKYFKPVWSYFRYYATDTTSPYFRGTNVIGTNTNTINVMQNAFIGAGSLRTPKPFAFATQNYYGQTSKQCFVFAYMAVQNAGEVGALYISSSTGDVCTLTSNDVTPTWKTGYLTIPCENVLSSSTGGMPYTLDNVTGNLDINCTKLIAGTTDYFNVYSIQIVEFN